VFVAISGEFSLDDHRNSVLAILKQYGFEMILKDLFESTAITETTLNRLKKDIDRVTDSYDIIRIYQYPLDRTFVITSLKDKKWRRKKLMAP
jgi:CRISPR-associated protein Cas2